MKITNQTSANNQIKDTYLDNIFQRNTSKIDTSFTSQNPINKVEDAVTLAHQVLGQKMTQVNTVV